MALITQEEAVRRERGNLAKLSQDLVAIEATLHASNLKRHGEAAINCQELEAQVLKACASAVKACGVSSDAGPVELRPLGSNAFGINGSTIAADESVNFVVVAPLSVEITEYLKALKSILRSDFGAEVVWPTSTDGPLAAPGLQFQLQGTETQLLLTQDIPMLPQPTGLALVQNTTGYLAYEATMAILAAVPSQTLFRQLLRCIRLWAKNRGVYGHAQDFGFFGGMAWAICCARACQTCKLDELGAVITHFFSYLSGWNWQQPLRLISYSQDPEEPWVFNAPEKRSSMVVALPVGKHVNMTSHASETAMKLTQKELERGARITSLVLSGKAQWRDLFSEAKFFDRHKHFIEFNFLASTLEVLQPWMAWGREHLKGLPVLFEDLRTCNITARALPQWIAYKDAEWPHARAVFVAVRVMSKPQKTETDGNGKIAIDLREVAVKILERISAWPEADRFEGQFDLYMRHSPQKQVQAFMESVRKDEVVVRQKNEATDLEVTSQIENA